MLIRFCYPPEFLSEPLGYLLTLAVGASGEDVYDCLLVCTKALHSGPQSCAVVSSIEPIVRHHCWLQLKQRVLTLCHKSMKENCIFKYSLIFVLKDFKTYIIYKKLELIIPEFFQNSINSYYYVKTRIHISYFYYNFVVYYCFIY